MPPNNSLSPALSPKAASPAKPAKAKHAHPRQKSAPGKLSNSVAPRSGSSSPQPVIRTPKKGSGRQRQMTAPGIEADAEAVTHRTPPKKSNKKHGNNNNSTQESHGPDAAALSRSAPTASFMDKASPSKPQVSSAAARKRLADDEDDLWLMPAVATNKPESLTWQQSLLHADEKPAATLKTQDDAFLDLKRASSAQTFLPETKGTPNVAAPALTWQQQLLQEGSGSKSRNSPKKAALPSSDSNNLSNTSPRGPQSRKSSRRQPQPVKLDSDSANENGGSLSATPPSHTTLAGFSSLSLAEAPGNVVYFPSTQTESAEQLPPKTPPRSHKKKGSASNLTKSRPRAESSKNATPTPVKILRRHGSMPDHTAPSMLSPSPDSSPSTKNNTNVPPSLRYAGPSFHHSPSASALPAPSHHRRLMPEGSINLSSS